MILRPLSIAVCVCATLATVPGPSAHGADDFARQSTYLFFIQGAPAGKSDIDLATEKGAYVFTSTTDVQLGEERHSLSCRTEFDKNTLRPRLFRYKGTRNRESLSGTVRFEPDSVRATLEVGGLKMPSRLRWVDGTFVFQNYVPEHLAVLARHLAISDKPYERLIILFPSDMMSSPGMAVVESEVELAARPTPVVCKKYMVSLQNSTPFYMYVDTKRNSLIYMDFPANRTEVFLQSAFGDHPETRYAAPPEHAPGD